jgi:hypothetical protein
MDFGPQGGRVRGVQSRLPQKESNPLCVHDRKIWEMPAKRKQPESSVSTPSREIRWRDKDAISDLLMCTICQDVFTNPTRISCGHSFCNGCVTEWFRQKHRDECPTCRTVVLTKASHRDLLAQAFLEREDVFCSGRTCNWMGPLGELHRHELLCRQQDADKDEESTKREKNFKDLQAQFDQLEKLFSASNN